MSKSLWVWGCLLWAAGQVMAAGSATDGAAKAAACTACHGPGGNGAINDLWPVLAGQNAAYVERQIQMFHHAARINSNNVMPPMVASLTDQDRADLAAYFSHQTPPGLEADPSNWQAGEKLYRAGDIARAIPACTGCHGPGGRGNPAAGYPALRAQHAPYTVKQLTEFASGQRYAHDDKGDDMGGANATIMHTIASRLSADEIKSLASYLQGMR